MVLGKTTIYFQRFKTVFQYFVQPQWGFCLAHQDWFCDAVFVCCIELVEKQFHNGFKHSNQSYLKIFLGGWTSTHPSHTDYQLLKTNRANEKKKLVFCLRRWRKARQYWIGLHFLTELKEAKGCRMDDYLFLLLVDCHIYLYNIKCLVPLSLILVCVAGVASFDSEQASCYSFFFFFF